MKKIIATLTFALGLVSCTNTKVTYKYDKQGRLVEAECARPKFLGLIGGTSGSCDIIPKQ